MATLDPLDAFDSFQLGVAECVCGRLCAAVPYSSFSPVNQLPRFFLPVVQWKALGVLGLLCFKRERPVTSLQRRKK